MKNPLYYIDETPDGPAIFISVLGEATPIPTIRAKNLLINHWRDANHYSRADPDRAKLEQTHAEHILGLLTKLGIEMDEVPPT
jgi:hypothetical protein